MRSELATCRHEGRVGDGLGTSLAALKVIGFTPKVDLCNCLLDHGIYSGS